MKTLVKLLAVFSLVLSLSAFAGPVNINTADAVTLASELTGVGPSKAATIVAYREAHGPFATADDLAKVKGIGDKTVEKNRGNILVSAPETK